MTLTSAPQQNWPLYHALTSKADTDWVRGLTTAERFAIYRELFNTVHATRREVDVTERLERARWQEQLPIRRRMLKAFTEMDRLRERTAAKHAC